MNKIENIKNHYTDITEGIEYNVDIDDIDIGVNPKKYNMKDPSHKKELERMAQSMKQYGQLHAIDITPIYREKDGTVSVGGQALTKKNWKQQHPKFVRIDGEFRIRTKRFLGENIIRTNIKLTLTMQEFIDIKWITCAKRIDINPLDMARAVDEFKKNHPELKNPYKRLSELTGYSTSYFKSRDDINEAPQKIKDMIEEGQTKANVVTEIKSNIPDKFNWRKVALQETIKKGRKLSTLASRASKPILQRAIKDFEEGKISEKDLKEQGRAAIIFRGTFPKEKYKKPEFALYERELRDFIDKVRKWNIGSEEYLERHKKLTELFQDLHSTWDSMLSEIYPGDKRGLLGKFKK